MYEDPMYEDLLARELRNQAYARVDARKHASPRSASARSPLSDLLNDDYADQLRRARARGRSSRRPTSRGARGEAAARPRFARAAVAFRASAGGAKRSVAVERRVRCATCAGSGAALERAVPCDACDGAGDVFLRTPYGGGLRRARRVRTAAAAGVKAPPCRGCRGAGEFAETAHCDFDVPPGAATGDRVTVRGVGGDGRGRVAAASSSSSTSKRTRSTTAAAATSC
ncbi:heat shock protein [Aureococcus anophagefferens]|uniref:Heat shock protein n=1 Tax=Aureococcus anophagefferens TaxID=44056 RepID=A0ABR1G954_AURAN